MRSQDTATILSVGSKSTSLKSRGTEGCITALLLLSRERCSFGAVKCRKSDGSEGLRIGYARIQRVCGSGEGCTASQDHAEISMSDGQ